MYIYIYIYVIVNLCYLFYLFLIVLFISFACFVVTGTGFRTGIRHGAAQDKVQGIQGTGGVFHGN